MAPLGVDRWFAALNMTDARRKRVEQYISGAMPRGNAPEIVMCVHIMQIF